MSALRRFFLLGRCTDGIAAVEFAFVLPVLLALFFGGYSVAQAIAISRKLTITTRALADLTTQFTTMASSDMTTVIGAATQIMAPYDVTPLQLRLSEVTTDSTGLVATVTWSVGSGMTAYVKGASFTLPLSMRVANTSYIYSETSYVYTPLTTFGIGATTLQDHIYMLPRLSASVSYTG